jgi:hypothetical protein
MKTLQAVRTSNKYHVEAFDKDGNKKWEDDFKNLVTTAGMNALVTALFKTGITSPVWYIGLVDGATTPVFDSTDLITSHAGWTEFEDYSESDRQTFVPGTVSAASVDNTASRAVFTITDPGTVAGCFTINDETKGGDTTGVLYGEGAFTGGGRPVLAGDTLRITITASVTD